MVNAYLLLEVNYQEEPELEYILPIKLAITFLREQAWAGTTKNELCLIWKDIYAYIVATVNNDLEPFEVKNNQELITILKWLRDCAVDFPCLQQDLKRFLENIIKLHGFLNSEKIPATSAAKITDFIKMFTSEAGEINLDISFGDIKVLALDFKNKKVFTSDMPMVIYLREHIADLVPHTLELLKQNSYKMQADKKFLQYQYFWTQYLQQHMGGENQEFIIKDIYDCPNKEVDPHEMVNFIAYLLFEVKFEGVKQQLLEKLCKTSAKKQSFKAFLEFFSSAKLTFFKVVHTNGNLGTNVKNIFTKEIINLTNIRLNYQENCKKIFFSFVNVQQQIVPSTILAIEVSAKQEQAFFKSLQAIYNFEKQITKIDFEEFLQENGLFTRILLVNTSMTPFLPTLIQEYLSKQHAFAYKKILVIELRKAEKEILQLAKNLQLTVSDMKKLAQLWCDFCNVCIIDLQLLEYFKFAAVLCYCELIYPQRIVRKIQEIFSLNEQILQSCLEKIKKNLNLQENNLQYLTEYGKIQLLIRLVNKE